MKGWYILLALPIMVSIIGIQQSFAAFEEDFEVNKNHLAYITEPLSTDQFEECEQLYTDYTTLDEKTFNQRYLYHEFVGNCVMLYDDPVWETVGVYRNDKLSERLVELVTERESSKSKEPKAYFEEKSIIELEIPGTYLYTFEGCTGDREIRLGDIYLASDKEVVRAPPELWDRIIEPGTCGISEIQIRADDPDEIRLFVPSRLDDSSMFQAEILATQLIPPKFQMKQGTLAEDVLCKEGLTLMIKASDGSAACVNNSTALKLEDRGWGVDISKMLVKDVEKIVEKNIEEDYEEALKEEVFSKVLKILELVKDPEILNALKDSNYEFATGDDIVALIDQRNDEWILAEDDEVTPFMETIIGNKASELLRKVMNEDKMNPTDFVYKEIILTNAYGANVAQTGKTTDYNQWDEQWWKLAKLKMVNYDRGFDESAGVYSIDMSVRISDENGRFLGVIKFVINAEPQY